MVLGTVRKLDGNGRVSIPAEMRDKLRLDETISLNVYEENGKIIICPVLLTQRSCPSCGKWNINSNQEVCLSCSSKEYKEVN